MADATTQRHVEWRVESETTEDEFGADESAARRWLAKVQEHVASGDDFWKPAVLMRRTVTTTISPWEQVVTSPGERDG